MSAFITAFFSTILVELGDKTQLLALLLVTRFRRPFPIFIGIAFATFLSQAISAGIGYEIGNILSQRLLNTFVILLFFAGGIWCLIPEKKSEEKKSEEQVKLTQYGLIATTFVSYFIAEFADKTQLLTISLSAKYNTFFSIVIGASLGMLFINLLVILLGSQISKWLPKKLIRWAAALTFFAMGTFWIFTTTTM